MMERIVDGTVLAPGAPCPPPDSSNLKYNRNILKTPTNTYCRKVVGGSVLTIKFLVEFFSLFAPSETSLFHPPPRKRGRKYPATSGFRKKIRKRLYS